MECMLLRLSYPIASIEHPLFSLKSLNLSSNMISEAGLEMIVDDISKNTQLQ